MREGRDRKESEAGNRIKSASTWWQVRHLQQVDEVGVFEIIGGDLPVCHRHRNGRAENDEATYRTTLAYEGESIIEYDERLI